MNKLLVAIAVVSATTLCVPLKSLATTYGSLGSTLDARQVEAGIYASQNERELTVKSTLARPFGPPQVHRESLTARFSRSGARLALGATDSLGMAIDIGTLRLTPDHGKELSGQERGLTVQQRIEAGSGSWQVGLMLALRQSELSSGRSKYGTSESALGVGGAIKVTDQASIYVNAIGSAFRSTLDSNADNLDVTISQQSMILMVVGGELKASPHLAISGEIHAFAERGAAVGLNYSF